MRSISARVAARGARSLALGSAKAPSFSSVSFTAIRRLGLSGWSSRYTCDATAGSHTKPAPFGATSSRLPDAVEGQEAERVRMTVVRGVRDILDDREVDRAPGGKEVVAVLHVGVDLGEVDAIDHRHELLEHRGPAEDDRL